MGIPKSLKHSTFFLNLNEDEVEPMTTSTKKFVHPAKCQLTTCAEPYESSHAVEQDGKKFCSTLCAYRYHSRSMAAKGINVRGRFDAT